MALLKHDEELKRRGIKPGMSFAQEEIVDDDIDEYSTESEEGEEEEQQHLSVFMNPRGRKHSLNSKEAFNAANGH